MKVPAEIIVNNELQTLLVQELHDSCCGPKSEAGAAFIPALRQAANGEILNVHMMRCVYIFAFLCILLKRPPLTA